MLDVVKLGKSFKKLGKTFKKFGKELYKDFKELLSNRIMHIIIFIVLFLFSMFLVDFALKHYARYYFELSGFTKFGSYLFTLSFSMIFLLILFLLKKRGKLVLFNSFWIIYLLLFISEYFHLKTLGRYWGPADLGLAGEATGFVSMVLPALKLPFIVIMSLLIFNIVISNIIITKNDMPKLSKLIILVVLILAGGWRFVAYKGLGTAVEEAAFEASLNPKNIYNNYDDLTKAAMVSGTPEYILRNVYLEVKNKLFSMSDEEMVNEIDKYAKENPYKNEKNEYTGIFKDKNVIFIMLESVDNFLVTKEVMPTLNSMKEEGLNFTNRYAPTFGGGRTFNTEFALLTSLYQPLKGSASFSYALNDFEYSFPKLFIEKGYTSSSMHYNTRQMYNRGNIHEAIGFEKYNGALNQIYGKAFEYDTKLSEEDVTYDIITSKDSGKKFASFIISYTGHAVYDESSYICVELVKKYPEVVVEGDYETSCVNAKMKETDTFIKVLIEKLKKDNLLDDTVLVFATDHEIYNYSKVRDIKQQPDYNLVTKVPFIIWSKNIEHKNIDNIMDTADVLPTLANMFDLNYSPVFSMGTDVFSKNHEDYIYFSDYSWYDNEIYFKGKSEGLNEETLDKVKKRNKEIKEKIKINKYILDSDYYRYKKKK